MRIGSDLLALSAVDLVGREMTWTPFAVGEGGLTMRIALQFSYDYDDERHRRFIDVASTTAVLIQPEHVGLKGVVPASLPTSAG